MLITIFEIAGKSDVLDLAGAVDLHERLGNRFEGASLAGASVHHCMYGFAGTGGQKAAEEHIDPGEIFDKDKIAALLSVFIAAGTFEHADSSSVLELAGKV